MPDQALVRALGESLELLGKGKSVANVRQTIHAQKRVERQIGGPFVAVEKCLRLRDADTK